MKKEKIKLEKKVAKKAASTKSMILEKATEIINSNGVIDFRIDSLSTMLNLSPGNITYHFPKKEDIITTIWQQCFEEIQNSSGSYVTPLMDIKQLYIYYKFTILTLYKYRGIVCYKLGDMGAIKNMNEDETNFFNDWNNKFNSIIKILETNGYVEKPKEEYVSALVAQSSFVNIFWSIHSTATNNILNQDGADKFAAVAIFQLFPILTEVGKKELKNVYEIINKI